MAAFAELFKSSALPPLMQVIMSLRQPGCAVQTARVTQPRIVGECWRCGLHGLRMRCQSLMVVKRMSDVMHAGGCHGGAGAQALPAPA